MITHIKRSIPDLRAIKHQPLENKESPCGSPKHHSGGTGAAGEGGGLAGTSGVSKSIALRNQMALGMDSMGCCEKDADAITLSAIQTTSCTYGPNKTSGTEHVTMAAQIDKTSGDLDDDDAMLSSGHHHHYHYNPYQHQQQQQEQQPPPPSHHYCDHHQHSISHQPGHEVR